VDYIKQMDHNANTQELFDLGNFKKFQPRLLNLHEFFKYMKKIVSQNFENDNHFRLSREIIQDFSFSDTLYNKCEEFMNLFFDNQ
jgi:hypothetical protein